MKTSKIFLLSLASALVLAGFYGCDKDNDGTAASDGTILFGAKALNSEDTRAGYDSSSDRRINWQNNDLLKIVCVQAAQSQSAVYKAVNATAQGNANLVVNTGSTPLCWQEVTPDNTTYQFYAAYPAGSTLTTAGVLTASVAAAQGNAGITSDGNGNWTVAPDMTNMTLVSKLSAGQTDGTLTFPFTPLSTAVKFVITNNRGEAMNVKSVALVSGVSGQKLAGTYTTDLSGTWASPAVPNNAWADDYSYANTYPECTALTDGSESVTIATPASGTQDYITVAQGKTLTATFFLQPTQHLYDIKFKITFSDDSNLALLIKRVDQIDEEANRVYFPRHAKSYVTGVFVPKGVQWVVNYGPKVTSWYSEDCGDLEIKPANP